MGFAPARKPHFFINLILGCRLVALPAAGGLGLLLLFAQDGLSGKLDFIALFADTLDHNLLAFLQFVAHILDPAVGDLRDVQEPVRAGKDFDERSEIDDARDRAEVGLTDLGFGGKSPYAINGSLSGRAVGRSNRDRTVVLDINLR